MACGACAVGWGGGPGQRPALLQLARCSTALAGGPCPPHLAVSTLLGPVLPALPAPALPASCPVLTLLFDPFSTSKSRRAARLALSPGLRLRQPPCPAAPALETTRLAGQQGPERSSSPASPWHKLQAKARVGLPQSTVVRPAQGPGQLRQGSGEATCPRAPPLPGLPCADSSGRNLQRRGPGSQMRPGRTVQRAALPSPLLPESEELVQLCF